MNIDKKQILDALKEVQDPELRRDVVSLGMVKDIQIEGEGVSVHLAVTASSEAMRSALKQNVSERLLRIPGVRKAEIEFVKTVRTAQAFQNRMPMPDIQNIVAVSSGKGGVGKTTVSVNLALALSRLGHRVGLMDGDIYGPNVPLMLGVSPDRRPEVNEEEKMIPIDALGIKMISMGVLVPPDQPMVWRGPMLHGAVTQFLQKVDWGSLDFLMVDLPPGTGDVQLSLVQTVPLSGAIMVTTPQEVALMDVRKGIAMFQKTHVPILGVIENMSGEIFGSGGGRKLADQYQAPFLGEVPLDVRIRQGGDWGEPVVLAHPESESSKNFFQAAKMLAQNLAGSPK